MDSLVFSIFSGGTVLMDGMKIRSTFCFARSRRCPCTSFPGKHTVSEVTADSPFSYIFLVLGRDSLTRKPNPLKKVVQKGIVSQKNSTRGMPIVTFLAAFGAAAGYS